MAEEIANGVEEINEAILLQVMREVNNFFEIEKTERFIFTGLFPPKHLEEGETEWLLLGSKTINQNNFFGFPGKYLAIKNFYFSPLNGVYKIKFIKDYLRSSYYGIRLKGEALNNVDLLADILNSRKPFTSYLLDPPPSFLNLVRKIQNNIQGASNGGESEKVTSVTSERFENYSYTVATGKDGAPIRWQTIFKSELNQYRRMLGGLGL